MAQRRLDPPHRVDRALRHAQAEAALQQDEAGADARDQGLAGSAISSSSRR
jgi:hypothetical protein